MVKALVEGLKLTFRHFFKKPVTLRYPEEKWLPPERFRGQLVMISDNEGEPLCVACGLCEKICPCRCITVVPEAGPDGVRTVQKYSVDLLRCSFCGLCVESCPVGAIRMSNVYELASSDKGSFILEEDALLRERHSTGNSKGEK
jgi:NADH-quinone oxidoreductase chain I